MNSRRAIGRVWVWGGLLVVLTGCTSVSPGDATAGSLTASATAPETVVSSPPSPPPRPAEPAPAPAPAPTKILRAKPAILLGSEETSPLLDNFTVYLAALDGVALAAGREGWNQPVTLPPGPHRLTLGFVRGVFHSSAELELLADPEAIYEIRHASDAQLYGKRTYCEFWVVNKNTGEKVTGVVRTELKRLSR